VRDILDDPGKLAIVDCVVGLATDFQRQIIVNGVETVAHGEMLLSMGCELAQDFAIAAMRFPAWIANWQQGASWTAWM
jgi:EAL domain-containing protein (putative c-di-GMP-specific phosphodiesterase class I)